MAPLLEVKDLVAAYGEVTVLRGVSLVLGPEEFVVVLGANGAGKTTLMNTIVGWLKAKSGTVEFEGEDITSEPPWRRSQRGIAVVPEGGRIFGDLTVAENLEIMRPSPEGMEMVFELFPVLKERMRQLSRTLSGGERQMLALARAIATQPKLLLVDEASTGLMPKLVDRVFSAMAELRGTGLPVLLVEQNTKVLDLVDRGYVMAIGELVHRGSAKELAENEDVRRAYLGM